MDEAEIHSIVSRLARPHASGGVVVERAALLAEGANFPAILRWIVAHGGAPETPGDQSTAGLHGATRSERSAAAPAPARRFVLPPLAKLAPAPVPPSAANQAIGPRVNVEA